MHLPTPISTLLLLATSTLAYDSISFTTWNCTDCSPVPGTFCSVNTRSQLPPNLCIPMWNGSTYIRTFDATIPSCQVNLYLEDDCTGAAEVHRENGGRCETKGPTNSFQITC
ncbi:hypothetical protein COCVIDRAFT_31876 [Bipolaris victoriae FI3]|uniref:Cyanovirin-N domain-containing protein n=2 Tax=Bipolaris TaxID=33194 RepID=W6YU31_COCC2|nr:uncharacterized protein COCCADRAFT_81785 [Bipolaris zeicola 26-R-13]XP_014550359.1 hypothetical protein COCVIDRAFT_31876 [Bipolaris victoriae FI3]EUC38929.1 hypothetical protein COCCADRAFT_81785 [Bipolaris zeicola 26-R-13]